MIKQFTIETPQELKDDPVAKHIVAETTNGDSLVFANYAVGHTDFIRELMQDLTKEDLPCTFAVVTNTQKKKKKTGLPKQ